MQCAGYGLPRILLPRTPVNKPVIWSWAMKQTGALKPRPALTEIARRPLSSWVRQALVARAVARVGEGLACYGDKLPPVGAGAEVKLEDTRGASLHHLHSRGLLHFTALRCAPGPGHELADPVLQICLAPGG